MYCVRLLLKYAYQFLTNAYAFLTNGFAFFGNLGILRNDYVSFLYSQMFFEFTYITIKIQSIIYRDVF